MDEFVANRARPRHRSRLCNFGLAFELLVAPAIAVGGLGLPPFGVPRGRESAIRGAPRSGKRDSGCPAVDLLPRRRRSRDSGCRTIGPRVELLVAPAIAVGGLGLPPFGVPRSW
jgi:hypothetical protein